MQFNYVACAVTSGRMCTCATIELTPIYSIIMYCSKMYTHT